VLIYTSLFFSVSTQQQQKPIHIRSHTIETNKLIIQSERKFFEVVLKRKRVKKYTFLLSTLFRSALGSTQPPIQWVPGALSPGVKRPGREVDHSHPTSAEVKKIWIYTSTSPYAFMA
jgi:hypothetical protein